MLTYRVEMPDLGGPFFTFDGVQRRTGVKIMDSEYVFAFRSMNDLHNYFRGNDIPEGCRIVVRDLPIDKIVIFDTKVMIPKKLILQGGYDNA